MLTNHKGDAMLEYVILGALVLAVVGAIIYSVATAVSGQGAKTGTWVTSINVPATHP